VKESKAYPFLRALVDGLLEAAPNWAKAPGKFFASLSDQLKDKDQEENKQLEKEIGSISEEKFRELIKEAGCEQKEAVELIVGKVKLVPEILRIIDYRFDKVDEAHEEIKRLLQRQKPTIKFPLAPGLHNQTPPEVHFVGRVGMLDTITGWYKNPDVRVGALIGWGGVGKSALVRKWYDSLEENKIRPDGIFWWGFYRNAYLEQFLNALLRYVSGGQIEPDNIKSTWEKTERIKEYIHKGRYLIVLDGLEQMQKGESGDEFGKMLNHEFMELLHYLADGPKTEGLCLITTRYSMKDLNDWESGGYENLQLIDLSEQDALLMLKNSGVKGDNEKIKDVIKRYKGHALSLTSLVGHLNRYFDGDIEQAPDVQFILDDEERFKDVNKLMSRYAEKMTKAERVFLNIFSLFRKDITESDFTGVFRQKIKGARLNKVLVKMNELDFRDLVNGLVEWRLIAYDENKKTYNTHPLIKGYFETDFAEKNKKLCHKRIYQYFGEDAPEKPETLEQMQPLFEQVYHGCAAGFYDEVYWDVYIEKINRTEADFITHKLGAWETALSIVKTFFPEGDLSQMPLVSKKSDQSWLLNEAGLALSVTGRPKEAGELLVRKTNMQIEYEDWANASVGYRNLTELQFRIGEIEAGLKSAQKTLDFAEKGEREDYVVYSKAYLGWILYLLGESEEGGKQFSEVDELSQKISGHRIHSIWGSFYADFLMSIREINKAFELTKQNLKICQRNNYVNNISRCHRCLGAIERTKGNYKEAKNHLQKALEVARKVGVSDLEIETLLEFGKLWLDMRKNKEAIRNANEVLKLCGRTGLRFYETGAEIVLGKVYLAEKDTEKAEKFAKSAYKKAASMKYRWAEGDAGHLLGEVYLAKADMGEARKHLEKAIACRKEILDPNVEESEKC
jgi:tetratricopeptide (TPR) repeat protein